MAPPGRARPVSGEKGEPIVAMSFWEKPAAWRDVTSQKPGACDVLVPCVSVSGAIRMVGSDRRVAAGVRPKRTVKAQLRVAAIPGLTVRTLPIQISLSMLLPRTDRAPKLAATRYANRVAKD